MTRHRCASRPSRPTSWRGCPDAVLVIDDATIPKKAPVGGVPAQYCGDLLHQANCRSLVLLTLGAAE
jgi:SRSO17 transposase